eukprot:366024-Chlamydomonas_euryale.AAC.20
MALQAPQSQALAKLDVVTMPNTAPPIRPFIQTCISGPTRPFVQTFTSDLVGMNHTRLLRCHNCRVPTPQDEPQPAVRTVQAEELTESCRVRQHFIAWAPRHPDLLDVKSSPKVSMDKHSKWKRLARGTSSVRDACVGMWLPAAPGWAGAELAVPSAPGQAGNELTAGLVRGSIALSCGALGRYSWLFMVRHALFAAVMGLRWTSQGARHCSHLRLLSPAEMGLGWAVTGWGWDGLQQDGVGMDCNRMGLGWTVTGWGWDGL